MKTTINTYFKIALTINVLIITAVLYIQYFLNIKPCSVCFLERYPYYLSIVIILIYFINKKFENYLLFSLILISCISFLLALYHSGLELGFIKDSTLCKASTADYLNKDTILKNLENNTLPSCKNVSFKFVGLSLASYNILSSLSFLILYCKVFLWIKKKR